MRQAVFDPTGDTLKEITVAFYPWPHQKDRVSLQILSHDIRSPCAHHRTRYPRVCGHAFPQYGHRITLCVFSAVYG